MSTLNLSVLIKAVDRATAPIRAIMRSVQGMTRVSKIAGLAMVSLGRDLRNMALVGVTAVTALSLGLLRVVRSTSDAGEAAMAASQKTGVAVTSYQRLAYAAEQAEASTEALDDGLKFLNLSIDAAGRGSRTDARAFAQLGIAIKDANGNVKPTEAIFLEAATALKGMEDGSRKAAIAQALFGRGGIELIPMLNEGGDAIRAMGDEAERAGLVLSEEAARNAGIFNDSLGALQGQVQGLGRTLATNLLPGLIKAVAWLRKMLDANRPEILRQLQSALTGVAKATPGVVRGIMSITKNLGDIARVVGPLVRAMGGFGVVLDIMAGLMIGRVAAAIWAATSAVMGLNGAMWANPIGLVIAGIAGLVFVGWLLYRNWAKVWGGIMKMWGGLEKFFGDLGPKIQTAFKRAVGGLWNLVPPWLRMIFKGVAFTLDVARNGFGSAPSGGASGSRPSAPRPALPAGRSQLDAGGRMRIDLFDNRRPQLSATPNDPRMVYDWGAYRGGVGG